MAIKNRKRVKWLKKLWCKLHQFYKADPKYQKNVQRFVPYINNPKDDL